MSLPQIVQGYIPVISINGQMYALVPTVETVSYSGTVTLAEALTAINEQITATASAVAQQDAALAKVTSFLIEHFDYKPSEPSADAYYLSTLFAMLDKVPSSAEPEAGDM